MGVNQRVRVKGKSQKFEICGPKANAKPFRSLVLHFIFFSSTAINFYTPTQQDSLSFVSPFTKLASLPFRFKGSSGANMAPIPQAAQHHHRSTTKISHKAFKTKHASKNSL